MKVNELFEATIPLPDKNFDKKLLADELQKLYDSPEYKEFVTKFDNVTGKVALVNGSLLFRYKGSAPGFNEFNINREGQIRTVSEGRPAKANSPKPAADYVTRYKNALAAVMSIMEKRITSLSKIINIKNAANFSSLTEITLPDVASKVTLEDIKFIKDLRGLPKKITGKISINNCPELTSLEGLPANVKAIEIISCDKLTSLEGLPTKSMNSVSINMCSEITSLNGLPSTVKDELFLSDLINIKSLEGISPTINGSLQLDYLDKITSLQGIHKYFKGGRIDNLLTFSDSKIKSHVLGLLLIPGLKRVLFFSHLGGAHQDELEKVEEIINKHLKGDRDIIECQQDLIDAGLKQYAQL